MGKVHKLMLERDCEQVLLRGLDRKAFNTHQRHDVKTRDLRK